MNRTSEKLFTANEHPAMRWVHLLGSFLRKNGPIVMTQADQNAWMACSANWRIKSETLPDGSVRFSYEGD